MTGESHIEDLKAGTGSGGGLVAEDANANLTAGSAASVVGAGSTDNIAIGKNALIDTNFTNESIAVGTNASILNAADGAIAIGENASVDGGFDAIAIGTDALVDGVAQGIAIGEGALADHNRALEIKDHFKTAFVATTDATPTVLHSVAIFGGAALAFDIQVIGMDQVANDVIATHIRGAIRRVGAGAAGIVGANDVVTVTDAGAAGWSITATASGNDLVVTVTGEAAHLIDWKMMMSSERLN
jgi:hypothetical protein